MAKNKKIPELSLQNTFKTAEKTLKMNTPSKKEKEEVDKKFGEKKSAGGAASLKKGPVTERRAAEIISENYAPPSPMPSQNRGRTGADVLKRAGEVWREEKRTVSPYSGMSYREMTDDINNTYGGELKRGNIGQLDFYLERGKYDRERIEKAGREELSELLSEKENEYNILFEMPRYSGGNYDVIDSRAKEVKALYDEIQNRINTYDTNEKIKKDYEREFYKYGKEALSGDSTYHPTESLIPTDYDIVNQFANARKENNETLDKLYNTLYDSKKHLAHLNDGEIKLLNSLHSENPEKAEAFLKSIEGTLNKRLSDYETQEAYKYAKEHPYIAGAKSVAENVLGGAAAAIDNIAEGITGDVDTYDYTSRVVREGQALRQGGSQYMKENHGKGAEFAYGAGLSIVENLANVALFKGLGKVAGLGKAASGLSAFNMASGAAANSMINIADRGGSDIQILTGGVASGVAEYLFEKYSFDKLFDIKSTKGIKNIVKALAIQSGVEGSEEIFTETANIISDALIMQGNSENNIRRRQYVMQGMSAEEATKKVFFETIDQIASAGAAGMLSGGIMGGGAIALNNISHNNYINKAGEAIVNNRSALERLIQLGLDEGNADARFAAELISQGERISGKEAGALLETIVGESISKNGGIANIIKNIYTLQGGDTNYITSKEAIDTARAVQHMAEGKVTDVDRALLQRSPGAVSLLSIVEGNEAAWKSLSGSAAQMQNAKGKMQNEIIKERGTPYTQKELVDEDVYSNGQKVMIPENGRVAKNIVLNDESLRVRREKAKDYKNVETLAEDLGMKVMYAKGLTDSNGKAIDGIVTSKGIIINSDAENISRFVATHEFSHKLKQISPEKWNSYQSYVIDKLKADGRYYDVFERKAAAYRSREDAIIDEEIAADYIGELFENETELSEFIRKDVKEASRVRNLWYNILDKLGLLDEKKKAQRMWASAYREGMSNKGKEFEGVRASRVRNTEGGVWSENNRHIYDKELDEFTVDEKTVRDFEAKVDAWLRGEVESDDYFDLGKTPVVLRELGADNLPVAYSNNVMWKMTGGKHGIAIGDIKKLPQSINNPLMVFKSSTVDNAFVIITELSDKAGDPVIAAIHLNKWQKRLKINRVASAYGKENIEKFLREECGKGNLKYIDKIKSQQWSTNRGLQLPKLVQSITDNNNILQKEDIVNRYSMQNAGKKSISGTRISDIENERTAQLEAEYTDFLRRNGGGIQTFRPEKEKGWLSQQWITQRSKDNKEVAKSLNEISDIISKDFKIPVTNRKFDDENVAGTFNYSSEVIHSRAKNDIVTIAHEVGHLLDKKLKLQKLDGIETLVSNFDKTLSALGYEEGSKKAESVGEFIRMYLTNEDIAKTFCPEYYDSFKKVLLNSEYSKALEKLSKAVNAYLSSTTSERINLAITNDIDERTDLERVKDIVRLKPLKTLVAKKEKFPELWRAFNQELIDSFYAIGEAQGRVYAKNPEGKYDAHLLATNSLNAAARSAYILTNEFVNMDGERVGESFVDCLTPIFHKNRVLRAKNISTLNRYLVLKHALEWIDPKQSIKRKKVFVDETLENPDILREEIAQIEKQNPQIKEAAEKIYQYLKNLKKYWGVDTGLITKELSTYLDEIYPCYVPFFRETKNKGIRGARVNLANQRAPILEATGGSGMIVNPLESIIRITEKYVKTSSRNMAMQAIAHMADNVEGSGFIIERADGSSQKALEGEDILGFNKNNSASATPEELKNINTEEESWKKEYGNGQGYVSVLINGKKIWYQINDEKLFKAVADMEPKRLNAFLRGCNVMLNLKRALITSNNPLFATTNAVRDAITAYNNIDINNPFEYIGAYFKAFAHIIKKDPNYKRWCAMGGGHSSELSANMNSVSRALKKAFTTSVGGKVLNSIVHPIELIASINDIVESTPRLMAFEHEMKKSGNVHKAINKADDITTNFKRGGRTAKALNNVFMFSNAAIQGLDRTIRSFTKKDTEHSRRNRIIKYAITSVFFAVVQQIINRQDDETEEDFKNLSKYMRRSNFVVGIGDGRFLRIPTAREQDLLRVLISDAINSAFEGKEALDGLIGFVIDTLWPWYVEIPTEVKGETATDILTNMFINTARNTPFGTLTDFASNKDFTGSPIIPKMYENEIAENQYNEKTSKLAVFLGKTFKESPLKIEYLINNNLGILGTVNKSLFPVGKSQKDLTFGFKTRWIADSYYSTDVLNKVYAKRDAAKEALKRFNDGKALAEYEKANAAATFIAQYNKIINVLPDNEKRNARGRLNAVINSWGNGNGVVTNELIKIYDSTGENLFMKLSKNEITTFNGKRSMTEEEYSNYALNHTAAFETALSEVVLSPEYSKMSDDEKIKALEKASKYASDYAKAEAIPDYELTKDEIDALKDNTKFMEDVLQSADEKRVENIGAELYEKYASSMENTENYKSEIKKLSQNGDSEEDIQKAVNSFGKKEGSYKKEKQKIYKEVKVDTSGLPKNEAEEVEKIIYQYAEDTAATQYIPGYTKTEYVKVYDTRLSSEMSIEEFAKHRAYAKKTAAMADGKEYMKKKELEAYLDSTNYSRAVKGALFDAIGNKGWKNKYTGKKVGEWDY